MNLEPNKGPPHTKQQFFLHMVLATLLITLNMVQCSESQNRWINWKITLQLLNNSKSFSNKDLVIKYLQSEGFHPGCCNTRQQKLFEVKSLYFDKTHSKIVEVEFTSQI